MTAERCFTAYGVRAHYTDGTPQGFAGSPMTFCGRIAVTAAFLTNHRRHVLAEASMCYRCEKAEQSA